MRRTKNFTAVIPAAGEGTRLKPHTHTYPKPLLTVGRKPILGHIIDEALSIGASKICFIIGYKGDKIREYVKTAYPKLNAVFVEQKEQKGLGHAVYLSRPHIKGPMFIILGDTIISADMRKFAQFKENCIGLKKVEDPRRFGVAELNGNGYVVNLVEKPQQPKSNLAVIGVYSFKDSAPLFSELGKLVARAKKGQGEIQLTDAIFGVIKKGFPLKAVTIDGWHDCGKPETLLETNRYLLQKNRKLFSQKLKGAVLIPPVYIARGAFVADSVIGPFVSVGAGARITESVISDSIISEEAQISNSLLTKSLIGPSAVLAGKKQQISIGEKSEISLD